MRTLDGPMTWNLGRSDRMVRLAGLMCRRARALVGELLTGAQSGRTRAFHRQASDDSVSGGLSPAFFSRTLAMHGSRGPMHSFAAPSLGGSDRSPRVVRRSPIEPPSGR